MKQLIILTLLVLPISVSANDRQETIPTPTQKVAPTQKATQKVAPTQKATQKATQKVAPTQKATQKATPIDDLDRKVREKAGKTRQRFCALAWLKLRAERRIARHQK